jgi:hypothetical protein
LMLVMPPEERREEVGQNEVCSQNGGGFGETSTYAHCVHQGPSDAG